MEGEKLRKPALERLVQRFFVQGSIPHGVGGRVPILQYNPYSDVDHIELDDRTATDWRLIKAQIGGRIFYNAPRLWQIGITEHYDNDLNVSDDTISQIVDALATKVVPKGSKTYRIRRNVSGSDVLSPSQYGAPPREGGRVHGRFDSPTVSILYTSPSLPVCLHESRVAIADDIFVATFEATERLRLANLIDDFRQENPSPFDDLRYFFNGITLSRDETVYTTARRIAEAVKLTGNFDGFVANSFFAMVSDGPILQNFCFFQDTIDSGRLALHSLNRIHLRTASYEYTFGPAFPTAGDPAPEQTIVGGQPLD